MAMTPVPPDPFRHEKLKTATFRLTVELLKALDKEAKRRDVSQSSILRGVLAEFLERAKK